MRILETDLPPLGMGCWPIGGPMSGGPGYGTCGPLGYAGADDAVSLRTLHAALEGGIRLFDTAAVYGAGHAERLLGQALRGRPDVLVVTKIGIAIDESNRTLLGEETDPDTVLPAIERALVRLGRDRIDIVLLHLNDLPVARAEPVFDVLERAVAAGKVRAYGWSTDLPGHVHAVAGRPGFAVVEHAMNVLLDAPVMRATVSAAELVALIRSPLGMGLLTGKYPAGARLPPDDIRAAGNTVTTYFEAGRPSPRFLEVFDGVRDLLQTGGRTPVQGALGWLWAKSHRAIPVPGARTVSQITEIAGALSFGPLPGAVVREIDALVGQRIAAQEDGPR